jgi:hypothetical protein
MVVQLVLRDYHLNRSITYSVAECLETISLALGLSNEWCRLRDVNGVQGYAALSRVSCSSRRFQ